MKRRFIAEAFGTFCLVFTGTGAVIVNQVTNGQLGVVGIGLVFGLVVLAMIYSIGHISGAHMNPAVTLAFAVAGRFSVKEIIPYIIAQIMSALSASLLLRIIFNGTSTQLGMTLPSGSWQQCFILEFALTLILMFVVMGVSTDGREEGVMAGVAIGATIALEAIFGGPISGASMNPARSLAPALISGNLQSQWIYWIAPILGGVSGAYFYKIIQPSSQSV